MTITKDVKILFWKPIEIALGPNSAGEVVTVRMTPINTLSIAVIPAVFFAIIFYFYCSTLCRARRKRTRSSSTASEAQSGETDIDDEKKTISAWIPYILSRPSGNNDTRKALSTFDISSPMPVATVTPPPRIYSSPRFQETSMFTPSAEVLPSGITSTMRSTWRRSPPTRPVSGSTINPSSVRQSYSYTTSPASLVNDSIDGNTTVRMESVYSKMERDESINSMDEEVESTDARVGKTENEEALEEYCMERDGSGGSEQNRLSRMPTFLSFQSSKYARG